MKKLIYATNDYSRALFDGNGNLIYGQEFGDDLTWMLKELCEKLNIEFEYKPLKPTDGDSYKIQDI